MKSGKQRRAEIREKRLGRAQKATGVKYIYVTDLENFSRSQVALPKGAMPVNPKALFTHSAFIRVPDYYQDKAFKCKSCGVEQLWTAKAQKWWYEIAKGEIESTALYCRACRKRRKAERHAARIAHFQGIVEKHGLLRASEILQKDVALIEAVLSGAEKK